MKKQVILYVFVLFLAASCAKLMPPEGVKPNPEPLEVHGGKISYAYSVVLPPKALPKGHEYQVKNFYLYSSQEKEVGTVSLKSEDYAESKTKPSKKDANFSFDYEPAMLRGELQLEASMTKVATGKTKTLPERMKIGVGVITTSELIQPTYEAAYAFHGYNDQEELIPNEVSFYFAKNSAQLTRAERRKKKAKVFDAFIASRMPTRTVDITGMHSPEGPESINTRLAPKRAEAIETWYRKRMDRYDYKEVADQIEFQKSAIVRNWEAFRQLLREFESISEESKAKMLEIVNGGGTFEDKEKALQEVKGYRKVYSKLYPSLRIAQAIAMSVKEKKPNAEIIVSAQQIAAGNLPADALSQEELLYGAAKTPLLEEKEAIYRAATKQHDSWMSHNNLGAVLLSQAAQEQDQSARNQLIEKASTQLEIATTAGATAAEITTNLAVVYLLQGNTERAYTTLEEASKQEPSEETTSRINALKGALEAQQGNYEAATASLSTAAASHETRYNKGLVALLKKDYPQAETAFKEAQAAFEEAGEESYAKNLTHARLHYCIAILKARQNTREGILEHLQKAIESDPSLKERAISDLEFRNYSEIVGQL